MTAFLIYDVVVPWTSGQAGDQNPIFRAEEDLDSGRIRPLDVQGLILGEEVIRITESNSLRTTQLEHMRRRRIRPADTYRDA